MNITIVNDGAIENPSETFSVSLVRDPMDPLDVVTISPDTATVTILDDDRELHLAIAMMLVII